MQVDLDRQAEWNQIFNECWRQMRDFVYDPNLHGVDWPAHAEDATRRSLPFVNHRADLTYIIGEMIGELNIGHAYVGGGDYPKAERVQQGPPRREARARRVDELLPDRRDPRRAELGRGLRSPLTEIGVDVKQGDYILAVNGRPTAR